MSDLIDRQAAIDAICKVCFIEEDYHNCNGYSETSTWCDELVALRALPSAQPEPLTDKEQRIFLAAIGREEKVCKEVDAEMTREPYEDSLVRTCHEIIRKVKGALWT